MLCVSKSSKGSTKWHIHTNFPQFEQDFYLIAVMYMRKRRNIDVQAALLQIYLHNKPNISILYETKFESMFSKLRYLNQM